MRRRPRASSRFECDRLRHSQLVEWCVVVALDVALALKLFDVLPHLASPHVMEKGAFESPRANFLARHSTSLVPLAANHACPARLQPFVRLDAQCPIVVDPVPPLEPRAVRVPPIAANGGATRPKHVCARK